MKRRDDTCAICQRMILRDWRDLHIVFMPAIQHVCVSCSKVSRVYSRMTDLEIILADLEIMEWA